MFLVFEALHAPAELNRFKKSQATLQGKVQRDSSSCKYALTQCQRQLTSIIFFSAETKAQSLGVNAVKNKQYI